MSTGTGVDVGNAEVGVIGAGVGVGVDGFGVMVAAGCPRGTVGGRGMVATATVGSVIGVGIESTG